MGGLVGLIDVQGSRLMFGKSLELWLHYVFIDWLFGRLVGVWAGWSN